MSDRISPTAHYTGYTWFRHGLSHPALVTREGRLLHGAIEPFAALSRRLHLPTLEGLLLARHHAIDRQLAQSIEDGSVGQVIEVAAGLSPRGWDFSRRYGNRIRYIEADLPAMARRKRALLERSGLQLPQHRVVDHDALADEGPLSLACLCSELDPSKGLAILTEGLINYFPTATVLELWKRFATALHRFPEGLYLSDLHLAADNRGALVDLGVRLLSSFVRGRVHLHFDAPEIALEQLRKAGFDQVELRRPAAQAGTGGAIDEAGAAMVRVVCARVQGHPGPAKR
jgi:O-methyltransferase involved in polyketide biosynthesis